MVKPGPKPRLKTLTDTQAPNSQVVKRKPGRPPKNASQQDKPAPKRRGRPPNNAGTDGSPAAPKQAKQTAPKRRGRPPKVKTGASETAQQHQEQAQSSQVQGQDTVVLEVVGTSIQPSFVIQDPSSPRSLVLTEASPGSNEGLLSKLPSRKEATMAKKLAVKRTQAMKKSTAKKVAEASVAAAEAAEDMQQTASSWGSTVWNTITAPVSYVARRLSGTVQQMEQ